jgi:hypothetical protein
MLGNTDPWILPVLVIAGLSATVNADAATTTIVAQHSNKCLDVRGGPQATQDGALIEQWTCTGATNQSWTINDRGGQQYELVASNSDKCVEVIDGSIQQGAGIHQATCSGLPQQLWQLRNKSPGVYEIVNVPSGRCLDVIGGPPATADGALTELWDCTGSSNQAWALTAPPTPKPLVAKHSGKCLDVTGGPTATHNGAVIEQWQCTGAANQLWSLRDVGGGQMQLVAQHSGKCIEPINGGTVSGTNLQQMDCSVTPGQLWTQQSAGSPGEFRLVHVPSAQCLDVTGGPQATADGALLELWDCTGAANQTWTIGTAGNVLPGTRDPLKWPFAQDSIWNMPIGSGAVYVPANLPASPDNPEDNVAAEWAAMPELDLEHIVLRPSAPLTDLVHSSAGWDKDADRCIPSGQTTLTLPKRVPIPTNYIVPHGPGNAGAVFLMPDGRTILQSQPFARCTAGGPATSRASFPTVDIYGDGRTGAHGGSKLSSLGGSIRVGELRPGQQGPRHALKTSLFEKMFYYNCSVKSDCFRWPASNADAGAIDNYGTITNNQNQAMKMGALLAIPPSININNIGLESEPGRQIAWTLQNYGAYIVDSNGGPAYYLNVEDGPDGSKPAEFESDYEGLSMRARVRDNTKWTRDLQRIFPLLHVVDNNSPTSIGGGGTPRQPLAPPFQ